MDKKLIGIVIAVVIIIAAIVAGLLYAINNDSLSGEKQGEIVALEEQKNSQITSDNINNSLDVSSNGDSQTTINNTNTTDSNINNNQVSTENSNTQNNNSSVTNPLDTTKVIATEPPSVTTEVQNNTSENGKILIAFFSRADENYKVGNVSVGNTEIMAGFIKDYLGVKADIFKIDPVNPYPVDYKECTEVATKELNSNARPAFKGNVDISKYDTIILGYPIWWRRCSNDNKYIP